MKSLKNPIYLALLILTPIVSCNDKPVILGEPEFFNDYWFSTNELIINVTPETESYRIVVENSIEPQKRTSSF